MTARILQRVESILPYVATFSALLGLWIFAASLINPLFFPPPQKVLRAALELSASGELLGHVAISFARILAGFILGTVIGVPLGLLIGMNAFARRVLGPYINVFRFIPPITMIIFAIVWLGAGESSKLFLVCFGTVFTIALNVEAGVSHVPVNRVRAARCLGATPFQVFRHVLIPSTVPFILTGMRISMGMAFAVITAAELISSEAGLGYLLEISRVFMQTDRIFVAVVALGLLGFLTDRCFRLLIAMFGREYVR